MADLVQANEFVFTPSAFVCAYIEQATPTETVTESSVFGAIDREGSPKSITNLNGSVNFSLDGNLMEYQSSGIVIPSQASQIISNNYPPETTSPISVSGSLNDLLGFDYNEAGRTDTKTTTKTTAELATVVLVLTYGQFRSKCANPQATVNSIYTQVLAYFNSL